jgi:hypothetical protein
MALQTRHDLAQAGRAGQLPEQQRHELAFAVQPAHPAIGLMPVHQPRERRPGNVLQKSVKNAIVMAHDIDLLLVSQTPRNV